MVLSHIYRYIMENKDEQEVRIPKIRRRIAIVALIVSVLVVITVPLAVSLPKVFKGSDKAEGKYVSK